MNIEKALLTEGWMHDDELKWLAEQASAKNLIVEIGSFKGRSTRALGDNALGKVIAIDHWNGEDYVGLNEEQRQLLYKEFCTNLSDLIESKKVTPYRMNSGDVNNVPELEQLKPDMVFIDGDHMYENIKRDIEIWLPKVVNGGLICGHDAAYYPVIRSVRELIPDHELVKGTTIWMAVKK